MDGNAELAAILAQYGQKMPEVVPKEIKEAMDETHEQQRVEGEWVLYSLRLPLSPRITKRCARCGKAFSTNYRGLSHCSNECVIRELRDKFGLDWRPADRRDKERWIDYVPPATIPYDALRAMKAIVVQAELDLGTTLDLGVELKPYELPSEFHGPYSGVSESQYKLPDLEKPSSASQQPQEVQSHSQEALVQEDKPSESRPDDDDPFAFLYADL